MGLFLSVQPSQEVRFGHSLRNNLAKPFYYTLRLSDHSFWKYSIVFYSLLSPSEEILDQIVLRKRWSHPLVSQIDVSQNGLYGTIYKPPGPGPFPCIIDIPGVNGNLNNGHASVFSAEGFVVYSFAFFDYKDLPKKIQEVDMEVFSVIPFSVASFKIYIQKHIEYIKSLPFCSGKIGIYGSSLGGTIALYLSTKHPELSAVVSLNGPEAFYKETAAMRENGKPM
ncbi:hypothetical protein CAEBREN_31277 [Caenorhabditis brenneri]|uniref:Uncharacterized protein n=1 Tax=Caenorhabditis brenneri TaxID=135651 RepID=G0NVR6_CAEBE|nr:hypothetical protein CAEBREN_31277 [Caenorhabditis brenneri]